MISADSARTLRFAVTLLGTLLLSACVNIIHKPIAVDSLRPQPEVPPCEGKLTLGQQCLALVHANQKLNSTRLKMDPGEAYRINVPPDQVWFDADARYRPPRGEPGTGIIKLFSSTKRVPDAGWFALIGNIVSTRNVELMTVGHDFGCKAVMSVAQEGTLVLYPNDHPNFYWNNGGQIWVVVERVSPAVSAVDICTTPKRP